MTDKPRKRRLSAKQKSATLFHFWHNLQDIKGEAEQMKDGELVLLVGMMELLVEERIALLGGGRAAAMMVSPTRPTRTSSEPVGAPTLGVCAPASHP